MEWADVRETDLTREQVDDSVVDHDELMSVVIKEGVKKNTFFLGTLSQTMGRWGSKVPNFLVKITIQSSLLETRFFRTLS